MNKPTKLPGKRCYFPEKTFELFQKPFEYLFNAEYLSPQVKRELKQAAVADGLTAVADDLIGGTMAGYNQPPSTTTLENKHLQ